ncbi:nicotianamine synthase family protein [Streptomyces sp. XD-27]|uniref:nicotianamine synthase family protein n=1 Tax=Streptomyces sp. XD-27 TaxID=3062779 RepID=UPI0026F468FB|nr:nicotianamine synthase family protein [Streptomyces sp. XD-27]WKX74139.1 nicotianamine synthase family protein [Streptomyces sp. XD-27]
MRPSPDMESAFGALVRYCSSMEGKISAADLKSPHADRLFRWMRSLYARSEAELERLWAHRIIAARDPWDELGGFPYLTYYRKLARAELAGAVTVGAIRPKVAIVLGSGPLPLTGILLARYGLRVLQVDRNAEACALGTEVVKALGHDSMVSTTQADAVAIDRLAGTNDTDLVVLVSLAGVEVEEKRAIARALAPVLRPDAVLSARGARGLQTALRLPVESADLEGFRVLREMRAETGGVNSVLLAQPSRITGQRT